MTLNCPLDQRAHPYAVPGQNFILFRRDMQFTVKIENMGKKNAIGTTYLTTFRIIFVPYKFTQDFYSFDLPIANISKQKAQFPLIGCTYLKGICRPYNNLLPGNIQFKLTFKNGGCDTFIRILSVLLKETRKRLSQNMNFQSSPMYHEIRNGKFNFNALMNPNDPSKIYTAQPVFQPQPKISNPQQNNQPKISNKVSTQHNKPYLNKNQKNKNPYYQEIPTIQQPLLESQAPQNQEHFSKKSQQQLKRDQKLDLQRKLGEKILPIIYKDNKTIQKHKNIQNSPYYPQICCFAYFINRIFKEFQNQNPYHSAKLHINTFKQLNPDNFYQSMFDGVILCQLINISSSLFENKPIVYPISILAMNFKVTNQVQQIENLNLVVATAKSLGCYIKDISSEHILKKSQKLILSLTWEILQIYIQKYITIKRYPQILLLYLNQQSHQKILCQNFRQIFLKWLNYHTNKFKKQGDASISRLDKQLVNFGYLELLSSLKMPINLEQINKMDQKQKVKKISLILKQSSVDTPVHYSDILTSKQHMHILLCFDMFRYRTGLNLIEPKSQNQIQIILDKVQRPSNLLQREMVMFNNWITSLGLKFSNQLHQNSNDLLQKLNDGEILLKIIDKLRPNLVQWDKRFSNKFQSRVHIIQNCNYVIQLCTQSLGIKLVNVQGMDIVDKKSNLVLGVVWQLCNIYWQQRVGSIKDESMLISWSNSKVPNEMKIQNLNDKSIASGIYIAYLIYGIKPNIIDVTKIKFSDKQQDIIININYSLSCARKLGTQILALWQHVKQSDIRFIKLIFAQLKAISQNRLLP